MPSWEDFCHVTKFAALFALPMLMLPTVPALAQSGAQCAAIGADAERLACYDGLFRDGAADADVVSGSVDSQQLIPARPSGRSPATITITCAAGTMRVAFAYAGNTLSVSGRDAGITMQSDVQGARSRTLPVDASNTAVEIIGNSDVQAFLAGLEGTTNLTTRITPVNSRSLNVRFSASEILEAAEPARAACF